MFLTAVLRKVREAFRFQAEKMLVWIVRKWGMETRRIGETGTMMMLRRTGRSEVKRNWKRTWVVGMGRREQVLKQAVEM